MNLRYLLLPGYGNSGPDHWQTLWEKANPAQFVRVRQNDWDKPICSDWVAALENAIPNTNRGIVLVAHSLACLSVAFWAAQTAKAVSAALLVAPPDPAAPLFPPSVLGFADFPKHKLGFPAYVVGSDNDPYAAVDFPKRCADFWGARYICLPGLGHINSQSQIGAWPEGQRILGDLAREIEAKPRF